MKDPEQMLGVFFMAEQLIARHPVAFSMYWKTRNATTIKITP